MQAIIHIGMPKTGSSSIQKTLTTTCPEGWMYPARNSGNMGRELILMFEDAPWTAPLYARQGASRAAVMAERQDVTRQLTRTLRAAAAAGQNTIFSAERLFRAPRQVAVRLRRYYAGLGYAPRVLGYVRAPVSFMNSAFQQHLKSDFPDPLNPETLYLSYRHGIEAFDTAFGPENVRLKPFDHARLTGGDAVVDFYAELGHDLPADRVVRVNETLSLPAVALLYVQRTLGRGLVGGNAGPGRDNAGFIAALGRIAGPPPRLARALVDPVLDRFADDLDWLEARLGVAMRERDAPDAIEGHAHLVDIAHAHRGSLDSVIEAERARRGGPRPAVLDELTGLRLLLA